MVLRKRRVLKGTFLDACLLCVGVRRVSEEDVKKPESKLASHAASVSFLFTETRQISTQYSRRKTTFHNNKQKKITNEFKRKGI